MKCKNKKTYKRKSNKYSKKKYKSNVEVGERFVKGGNLKLIK